MNDIVCEAVFPSLVRVVHANFKRKLHLGIIGTISSNHHIKDQTSVPFPLCLSSLDVVNLTASFSSLCLD